jgi:primosomal protein N' (replication factor Y)
LRNNQIGDLRVVEELGKSLPNQKILFSNRDHRLFTLENESVLVVATPGSEPIADLGYSAIAVVNSNLALERAALDADVDARNRWFALATLLRKNGTLFVDTETSHPTLQALIRWNPIGAAVNELEERKRLNLPPAVKTIEISGEYAAVSQIVRNLPDYVLVSNPQRNELGESAALIRIVSHQPLPVVQEIFGRVASQSASGAPMARVKVDPVSI